MVTEPNPEKNAEKEAPTQTLFPGAKQGLGLGGERITYTVSSQWFWEVII
jgi:hypothetical protein